VKPLTDHDLEASIGNMLRVGVTLSALIVFAGGVLYLLHVPAARRDYGTYRLDGNSFQSISGAVQSAARGDATGIIEIGILLLIATPIVRVVFCVVGFGRQKDWLYVGISAAVLAILLYSLLRGSQ
jgi:uncharacterized membrane protein